jgi:hypothetical protein
MTSNYAALAVAFIGVAVAGVIIGVVLFGMDESTSSTDLKTVPLLEAIATSVAPPEATMRLIDTLPDCRDPDVEPDDLCAPIQTDYPSCAYARFVPDRQYAEPCRKQREP